MSFRHSITVRYGEVDMQSVVFNAHYLAYVDDAMTAWMNRVGYSYGAGEFDFMVRHAEIEWRGSATFGDVIDIDCSVEHWGSTSFRVLFLLHVEERPIVDIRLTYVGIRPGRDGGAEKAVIPDEFRSLLST